jgi:serine protease
MSPDVGCTVTWHGTHVAGTLAAVTNNGSGVAGVAWGAKVLPVRVLNGCGSGYVSDIADGIVWATGGSVPDAPVNIFPAQVVNMSLGGLSITGDCARTYQTAIDGAVERGATIVVAAGNNGREAGGFQPANCNHVIVVAGHQSDGQIVDSSNRGSLITVSAPGWYVRSTYNDGKYFPGAESYLEMTGTSMATPHVAGVAALMQSVAPTHLTPGEVRSILKRAAREIPLLSRPPAANLVDATDAVRAVKTGRLPPVADFNCVAGDMMYIKCTDKSSHRGGTIVSRSYMFDSKNGGTFWTPVSEWSDVSNFYEYPGIYYVTQKVTDSAGVTDQVVQLIEVDSPEVQTLTPNQPVTVNSNGAYSVYFSMEVPAGATDLKFKISGGDGNANLYVRKDSPTLLNALCAPNLPGNEEECTFTAPAPGTYYVLLNSQPDFRNVTLVGSYTAKKG